MRRRLSRLGWRVTLVPWGDPGAGHRIRTDVLHVFSGGMEPVSSGTAAMADRLSAVRDTLALAGQGACSVLGICLGAQMIAAVAAGLLPQPVAAGGEAGLTGVRGHGAPDLVVPTAHVQEVPPEFLTVPGARHLWSSDVTAVQGFGLGERVVGVQFHPELSAREGRRAARSFQQVLDAPPVRAPHRAVDPLVALRVVLAAAAVGRLRPARKHLLPDAEQLYPAAPGLLTGAEELLIRADGLLASMAPEPARAVDAGAEDVLATV